MRKARRSSGVTKVVVFSDRVEKESVSEPDIEQLKALRLAGVGAENGFCAPRPLGFLPDQGMLVFERVETGTSLAELLRDTSSGSSGVLDLAFAEAGRVLGSIHRDLEVETAPLVPLPSQLLQLLPEGIRDRLVAEAVDAPVVGHGDYGTSNLFLRDDVGGPMMVVLDSLPNFYSSFRAASHESRYVDLALFETCLMGRGTIRDYLTSSPWRSAQLRKLFLDAYGGSSGVEIDRHLVRETGLAVLASYFLRRRRWPAPATRTVTQITRARDRLGDLRKDP